LYIAPCGVSR